MRKKGEMIHEKYIEKHELFSFKKNILKYTHIQTYKLEENRILSS